MKIEFFYAVAIKTFNKFCIKKWPVIKSKTIFYRLEVKILKSMKCSTPWLCGDFSKWRQFGQTAELTILPLL